MEELMKAKYIAYIIAGIAAFLSPLAPTLYFVGVLVVCDFTTGVLKAYRNKNLNSRKMIKKFYDSSAYMIGIIVASCVENYFGDAVPIVKATVAIIALTELQSLRENIKELTGTDVLQPLSNILKKKSEEGQ